MSSAAASAETPAESPSLELEIADLRAEVAALKSELAERDRARGAAREWVETLRRADKECIASQEIRIRQLQEEAQRCAAQLAASENYVAACLGVRASRYPSQEFTLACARASDCYHELLAAFGQVPPP